MFSNFFYELKNAKMPVSLQEYFILMDTLQSGLVEFNIENFYYLSRATLVKDERHFDRFDQIFSQIFKGTELTVDDISPDISESWLTRLSEHHFSGEEKAQIKAMGGLA